MLKILRTIPPLMMGVVIVACSPGAKEETAEEIKPPVAEKVQKELVANGGTRVDNYYWMQLTDAQKNSGQKDEQTTKVVNYLTAENDYLSSKMKHTEALQEKLFKEITGRIKQTDESVPYKDNGFWYYTRYEEGQEYPIYCRKKGTLEGKEEILLNVNEMAKGHNYYAIRGLRVSEDNNLLAYAEDSVSRRRYTLYVKDLRTNKLVENPIPNTEGYVTWANDNKTYFYTKKDSTTLRSRWIVRHKLGSDVSKDQNVFEEKDETFSTGISKTKSDKFLVIASTSTLTSDHLILDANKPDGQFKSFSPREKGIEYSIDHYNDKFYIVTNLDAQNFRLMETPDTKTSKENWKEKIAHRKDTLLEDIEIFKNYLVLTERAQANTHIRIIDQKTGKKHYLNFGEPAYTVYSSINLDFDSEVLRYGYTSMKTPNSQYDYNMRTLEKKLLKQQEVVGGYNPEDYQTERIWATADDGTPIPMSLVYKKGIKKDGSNPTLIYGYGSYGYSMDPVFDMTLLSLLNRGFVYAIAHIRGGQEMGRKWYEDGKMFKKNYPNMLVTTGFHDSQVQYWEPAKWVAKLREMKTDNNTLLLRTNMETGHGGTTGRFKVYKEDAQEYAFMLDLAGIKE